MKKLLLATSVILFSVTSSAQIRGYIVDENSTPLSGAVVILTNKSDSTLIASTVSNDNGVFSFNQKADVNQLLNISMLGYANLTIPAKEEMGNLIMTTKAIEMETVTVKGAAFTASSDRFTFMISNPALIAGNDAVGILQMTPLLQATDESVSIAGKNTKVYVNNREVKLNGASLSGYLRSIPAEDIVKIEIMPVANSTFKGQGNFGVINIILRKKETNGVKGSLSLTDKQGHYNSQSVNLNVSGRKNKVGVDAYLWGSNNRKYATVDENMLFEKSNNTVLSNSINKYNNQNIGAWIGLDYDINDKQVLGFIVNGDYWHSNNTENNHSVYGKRGIALVDSTYNTSVAINTPMHKFNANINYQIKMDTLGSVLVVDVDFTNYGNPQTRQTAFDKLDNNGGIQNSNILNQSNPLNINIWSGRAMYTHYFKKYGDLSVGLDNYTTSYDNKYTDDNKQFNNNNQFLFTEAISGIFASYSNVWTNKFSTTLGFRIENAFNQGHQLANGESFRKSKTRFLPSVYINYAINKNNNLSFALSNRLEQPSYSKLNPFKSYTSPTNYNIGNPYLEATNFLTYELQYMFKGKFMVELAGVTLANDVDTFTLPDGENGTKTLSLNFGRRSQYFLTFGQYGSYFNDVWQANNRLVLTYNTWKGAVEGIIIDHSAPHWFVSLGNNFTLSKTHKIVLETYFWYQCKVNFVTGQDKPYSSFNLSLRKSFKDFSIRIYANDIFKQNHIDVNYNYMGLKNEIRKYYDTQEFGIRLSYSFGNMKTKGNRSRETSSSAVEDRL